MWFNSPVFERLKSFLFCLILIIMQLKILKGQGFNADFFLLLIQFSFIFST